MRAMFGERSPVHSRRDRVRDREQARPLTSRSTTSTSSRRRDSTFLKYGTGQKRNSSSMNRTRAHAKQIAMKISQADSSLPAQQSNFADFGNAFGNDPFASSTTNQSGAANSSATSFFDEDPFSTSSSQQRSTRKTRTGGSSRISQSAAPQDSYQKAETIEFPPQWPLEEQSMQSLPANSSMQSSYPKKTQDTPPPQKARKPRETPPPPPRAHSPIPSVASGASVGSGAAARRRMRSQLRTKGSLHRSESEPMAQTPPQSPHSMKRYQSSESIGSTSRRHAAAADHVANYSMSQRGPIGSANRSVSSANRSVASSTGSSSDPNLWDSSNPDGGFNFDAFGLDASQINREVNEAMKDIAGTHPDLSFFIQQDPNDDFAAGRWDSPMGSRSSTPGPSEEDGFVDGFRVTKQSALPMHVRNSPNSSTEKSSLTSESSERYTHSDARVNLFKEKAGFHATSKSRRVVRPSERQESMQKSRSFAAGSNGVRRPPAKYPSMPVLEDGSPTRKRREDVEFVDVDDRNSEVSGPNSSRPASDVGNSDVGVASDVAFASDVGVSSDVGEPTSEPMNIPLEVKSKEKRSKPMTDENSSTRTDEEKKEEHISPDKDFRSLKKRWETKQDISQQQQKRPQSAVRKMLNRDHIEKELGSELKKVEKKKVQPQQQRAKECSEQRTSFGSLKERLKSSSLRDRSPSHRDNLDVSTRSEGGAAFRNSHVSSILSGLRSSSIERESPRDAMSDTGGSPAFYGVKLRKTGLSRENSPITDVAYEGTRHEEQLSRELAESPQTSDWERSESSGNLNQQADKDEPQPRKLTYRERRELELQKEEEERPRSQQADSEPPQRDVASLIKRRVAANKKNSQNNFVSEESSESSLKPGAVQSVAQSAAAAAADRGISDRHRGRTQSRDQEESDLIIDEDVKRKREDVSQQNAAVSRLSMLQELQQRESELDQSSRPSPAREKMQLSSKKEMTISTAELTSKGSGEESGSHKIHTPKATMMMLNAFLAGRESISSGDGASTSRQSQGPKEEIVFEHNDGENEEMASEASQASVSGLPALKDDPKYERYFKMLKIGMPMEVVKHAMIRDGLDPSVMDGDHNKPVGIPLKDDPTYQKYFKMLKVGLPLSAVKHAMERDGLDSSVMDQDHDLPVTSTKKSSDDEPKEKDSHRRARLHWNTLRKVTSNSLWAKIDQDEELENIEIDEEEFQELFQAEKTSASAKKAGSVIADKRTAVRVIDPKRANNGGIVLARLKMSHDDMADAVDRINENALTAEQIENIIEYLPTKEERKALESYMLEGGQDAAEKFDGLCECEKFMVSMMTVKHAKRKVKAILFKLQFETVVHDILNDTITVEDACDELSNSVRLRQLLGIVLTFGNRLNTAGNGKRKAGAFTLDSLLKLNQAKAFDKKTTFLNYIVLIVQRNNELLLRFKDDVPTVFKADKVFWDQCLTDLEEVENQLENVRRISLYQARQARAYRLRRKKHKEVDGDESLSDGEVSLSLEEEVEALRATPIGLFTLSAIKYVSSLRDKVEGTKIKFGRLLEYFGEEEQKLQPHELFSIIASFSRDFDKAKEEVFTSEKIKKREERKRQATNSKTGRPSNGKPKNSSAGRGEGTMLKVSNHQPSMSGVFSELKTRSSRPSAKNVSSTSASPSRRSHLNSRPIDESQRAATSAYASPSRQSLAMNGPSDESRRGTPSAHASPSRRSLAMNGPSDESRRGTPSANASPSRRSLAKDDTIDERRRATPSRAVSRDMSSTPIRPGAASPGPAMHPRVSSTRTPQSSTRTDGRRQPGKVSEDSGPAAGQPPTPSSMASMRHKARMRRQRHISGHSPSHAGGSKPDDRPYSPARSDSVGLNDRNRRSGHAAASPTTRTEDDAGAQPLSPRSNFRHRRRMEQRQQMQASS